VYRILVAVSDDVDQAIEQARFVTSMPGAADTEVHVAHAYDDTDDTGERGPHGQSLPPAESEGVQAVRTRMTEAGIAVETHETYHPVEEGIVDLATDVDADLVVVGGRRRSPVGKALFGSVTQSVVLNAPVPVTVVGVE
jgi:nucleotide-binding universal stress UspA family protein